MIYKIRIILDADDDVFRDIAIEANRTMEDLHNVITQAFGFLGNEMASFYTCDDNWQQDEEIALFDMGEGGNELRLMANTTIETVLNEVSPKMIYIYDFLSMWSFFVELADIVGREPGATYPNLLFSHGEVPETPPEKSFEADPSFNFDEDGLDNYEDLDFDENWN